MSTIKLRIDNAYDSGHDSVAEITTTELPDPSAYDRETLREWADEHLFPLTGSGREHDNAYYAVKIESSDNARLIGLWWEWA